MLQRPTTSTTAVQASTPSTTRWTLTSDRHALRTKPALELVPDDLEPSFGSRLESQDENGLGVGRADQPPAVAEEHSHPIHVVHVVPVTEVLDRARHDIELPVVATVDANLGRADERRHVGQQLADGAPGIGNDTQQARGAIERV